MKSGSKSDLNQKKKYQSYYFKKLQTQSSLDRISHKTLSQTSDILEKQIQSNVYLYQEMEHSLYERNSLYARTLKRKSTIEQQQQKSRTQLKNKIESKMRKSQQNLLSFRQKSNSSLSSRLKAEAKKIEQIKRLEKTFYNDTYQKSKEISTKTQKFFQSLTDKKKVKSTNITFNTSSLKSQRKKQPLFLPLSSKIISKVNDKQIKRSYQNLNPEKSNTLLAKNSTRQSIEVKQKKKFDMQKAKQDSFLQQYASKLQSIEIARKKSYIQKKVPQSTISKFNRNQDYEDKIEQRRKFSKSFVNEAVNSKGLFSELYQKKLQKKQEIKSFFLSQSLAQGDLILKGEMKQKSKLKLNKLIRETKNELARKQNFRYMEKYLNKKI